jgi:hydroxymethylbilane synthase
MVYGETRLMDGKIRLGTRGSKLALCQADIITKRLHSKYPQLEIERVVIQTSGDKDQTSSLKEIGGKGVFIKEIEAALLSNQIDFAVHSFKDITSEMPTALELVAFLTPETSKDAFLSRDKTKIKDLPAGSRVATSSTRRRFLLKEERPDLTFVDVRGNVETRLKKLQSGEFDGLVLSEAGLVRLRLTEHVTETFNQETFLPAPGQGVIAIQTRKSDQKSKDILACIGDSEQTLISKAELVFLDVVGFDCNVPLGVLVTPSVDGYRMDIVISNESETSVYRDSISYTANNLKSAVSTFASKVAKHKVTL